MNAQFQVSALITAIEALSPLAIKLGFDFPQDGFTEICALPWDAQAAILAAFAAELTAYIHANLK